jgi:regulator of sirC expression with transglutaminase-like and TPR domain
MDTQEVWQEFTRLAALPDKQVDLARAALLIAATEYPGLDIQEQLGLLDSLASVASRRLGDEREPLASVNILSGYLFDEVGFRGNQDDYYDPRNSFLNEVLARRLGIPITLSLVYIEVGKRLGVPLVGVGMPGHFLVRHRDVRDLFVDPFYGGILLSEEECAQRMWQATQSAIPWDSRSLAPIGNRQLIARMLRNLKIIYLRQQDYRRALGIINLLLALEPRNLDERRDRGLVRYRLGDHAQALEDLRAYLSGVPEAPGTEALQRLVEHLLELLDR